MLSTALRQPVLALLFAMGVATPAFADDPWDRPPGRWTRADIQRILTESPWSPAEVKIRFSVDGPFRTVQRDPLTRMPADSPELSRHVELSGDLGASRSAPLPEVQVQWLSSRTLRLAQQRLEQLDGRLPASATLNAASSPDIVIAVRGSEWLRILRDASDDLKQTVYLELSNGMALDFNEVRFVEGERAGDDYVAFHFPRQLGEQATVSSMDPQIAFRCRATARTPRPNAPNAIDVRVEFEPRKMRAAGRPDL